MARYRDELYADTLNALIGDIYYAKGVSIDAKIARMRKLSEVIVRRLIGYDPNRPLTLGHRGTRRALRNKGMAEQFLHDAIDVLNSYGNDSTHAEQTDLPAEEEFDKVSTALADLFAYLFYDFFKRFGFGTNDRITTAFSKLPPYLRFTVLKEFVFSDGFNFTVLDKLSLAAIKALGTDGAIEWTERERDRLSSIDIPFDSEDAAHALETLGDFGPEGMLVYAQLLQDMSGSAYDYLMRKIPERKAIEQRPMELRYDTFEEAKRIYLEHGTIEGDTEDVKEFNALVEFIFQGRRSEEARDLQVHTDNLITSLKDLYAYCEGWKDDESVGAEVSSALTEIKAEIDEVFSNLI